LWCRKCIRVQLIRFPSKPAVATTLKRLHFTSGPLTKIRLDRDVRDYLVAAVTRQGERSRNDLFRKHGKPPIA
jgi:hypothetical protein